jgi:hypothetical protein
MRNLECGLRILDSVIRLLKTNYGFNYYNCKKHYRYEKKNYELDIACSNVRYVKYKLRSTKAFGTTSSATWSVIIKAFDFYTVKGFFIGLKITPIGFDYTDFCFRETHLTIIN